MAKATLNAKASAILAKINADVVTAINARKNREINNPDAELSELELLTKQCTEGLNELDKLCNAELKGVTDTSVIKVTKARYKLLKAEMESEFEKEMTPLKITPEVAGVISEVVCTTGGHKVGNFFSAPIKGVVGFVNGFGEASGLSKFNLFGRK